MTYSLVASPGEEAQYRFDFWHWREARRDIIALLRAISRTEIGRYGRLLASCADALETEQFTGEDEGILKQYVADRVDTYDLEINNTYICKAYLDVICSTIGAVPEPLKYVDITPDWSKISTQKGYFAGELNGVYFEARLERHQGLIPPYSVIWIDEVNGESEPLSLLNAYAGRNLTYSYSVWDWLMARQLASTCFMGKMGWPKESVLVLL